MESFFDSPSLAASLALLKRADLNGWHERNGGNFSCRLTAAEASEFPAAGTLPQKRFSGLFVPSLDGDVFVMTVSGSFIGEVASDPRGLLCVIRVCGGGSGYELLYCPPGARPTSELESHLLAHDKKRAQGFRVVYHCHPDNLIALSFAVPLDARTFSNLLWRSISECALVFPEGIGVLDWMVPGSRELALASAAQLDRFNLLVWAHHGVFATGTDLADAFSRVDTAEKAARVYLTYSRLPVRQRITASQLIAETEAYGLHIDRSLLE